MWSLPACSSSALHHSKMVHKPQRVMVLAYLLIRDATDVWANLLFTEDASEVVGFDVGLCTLTPAVNNTGVLFELCTTVHYFNNGTDQVVLSGSFSFTLGPQPQAIVGGVGAFNGASGTCIANTSADLDVIYACDFWTPNFDN
jgi:hypothetical protein